MRAEEIAGFGHWELHLDNKAIYVSPGAKKIYGTDRTQEPYDEVKKIPLPEYRELLDKEMADLIETGRPYDIEYRARHPSGGQIVYVHSRAEYDPVRRIVFGVIQDITERKMAEAEILSKNEELASSYAQMSAAEEELRAAQHRLAVTMDLAKLVYWELDTVKNIFIFNDRFYAIYGTTAEREGGNFMTPEAYTEKFVYPDDRERVAVVIERNLSSTIGINTLEHKIVRRDGQVRDIVVCIEVERDLEGRPVRIYGANQDITERKQAEVALERANRKLGLLNSITRHDITNQLTVLRGNLELLKISVNDREIMARLDKVERSSQIILDQIRFTKEYQDMGSTAPQWQRVRGIVPSLPQLKEIKHLRLSEGAEKLSIYADPMLPKVFSNLIENTLRYGSKPATVRIECEPSDHGMKLIYEDDGPGIPIDDKQNIFRKGFGKGTGLGLFLSQEILAITGITIEETGIPGHGARFELSIPSNLVRAL
jgi:PAS domain S-box-containing protein